MDDQWSIRAPGLRAALLILTAFALFGASLAPALAAQTSDSSYEFAGGQSLTWDSDWDLDDDLTYVDGDLESVTFTQGVALFSVLSVPNDFDLNEARDIYLESLLTEVGGATTIDRGDYGAVSYSLDLAEVEGFDFGVFTLFRAGSGGTPTFAYIFFSEIAGFAAQFASAQATFRLDAAAIYDGVDGGGLQAQLETVADDDQPEPDDGGDALGAPIDEPTAEPESTNGLGGLKGGDGSRPAEDEREVDRQDTHAAYASPQFGVELDWGAAWELDSEAGPPESDPSAGVDSLFLTPVDGGGFLTVTFIDAGGTTVPELVEVWESSGFVADSAISADAEVILADSSRSVGSMVLRDYLDDGTEIVVVREAALVGETMVVAQLSTLPNSVEEIVASAQAELSRCSRSSRSRISSRHSCANLPPDRGLRFRVRFDGAGVPGTGRAEARDRTALARGWTP